MHAQDINLPRPDKYQTAQLVAFLQQLLTHEGYYVDEGYFRRALQQRQRPPAGKGVQQVHRGGGAPGQGALPGQAAWT